MRPWIAAVAAYALALQVLLTGVTAGHFMAAGDAAASSLFVICHGNSSSDDRDLPGKEPLARSPCILCTLAKTPCAILPTDHGITVSDAIGTSNAAARTDGPVLEFNSPTGRRACSGAGRSQESSAPPAESTGAPKPDTEQSAPAPAEPSAPAEAAPSAPAAPTSAAPTPAATPPGAVRVPEVVVTPPKPERLSQTPRPRAIAAVQPPASAVVQPATPPPPPSAAAAAPGVGPAESRPAPGALPKPPGQTITTVSGERIKNEPAFTVQELLQESPGVSFKQGNGPILRSKEITLFALIDHSGEAAKVGMKMPPTKLLIFGNPKGGTPLMLAAPSIALDLPLKILVSEDAQGKVWLSYNSPEYLKERHGLPSNLLPNIAVIETLAANAGE